MAKTKNKKSNLSEVYAKKRKQQQIKKKLTPFEVHVNKDKKQVLGRKSKSDHGLPGISRTKAISKRKNTLLHEYNRRNKDNIFLDKRIGEKDSKLSSEDKALARFAAERIKAHKKKNIFNLNDEEILTHHGQALIDIEKFDDPKSDDDDYSDSENKTGKLDKKFVEEAHFGGGLLSKPESSLSRKDLIEQLIVESKKRKAERQKIREETIDLTEKLDSEWKDLLPIVASSNKALEKPQDLSKPDDFDIALKTLKFEARGMATDKLKSEEEIAKEEKDKLEKLEEERLARMKGFDESDAYKKHRSADDLDDFQIEQIEEEPLDDEKLNNDADSESINSTSIEQKNNSQDKSDDDCEDGSDDDENSSSEDADSSDADSVDSLEDLKQSDSEDESNLNPVQVHLKTDQKEDKKTLNADLNQQKKNEPRR